ncbi:MAG: hypothetical protein OEX12_16075, partial [Gammaproteobacteria bacterium]|nr:hypothetical protein [Gammaproteobacteria bacterium]
VTLSGVINTGTSTPASAGSGISKLPQNAYSIAQLAGYKLFCVTFTTPPESGEATLVDNGDGTYGYNVTINNANGLPIGCFINDTNNVPVSTVTFNVEGSSDLSGGSSGATLTGGAHTIDINFDPVTGVSTATVSAAAVDESGAISGTEAATLTSTMAGSWNMSCSAATPSYTDGQSLTQAEYDALSECHKMLWADYQSYWDGTQDVTTITWNGTGGSFPLYLNVISGTQDGNNVHALGIWPSATQFADCGSTEGMSSTALAAQSVTVTGQTSTTGNPVGNFTGIHTTLAAVSSGGYDVATDTTTGDTTVTGNLGTIKTTLHDSGVYPYDHTFDDGHGGWCDATTIGLPNFGDDTELGRQQRSCYADFMGWSMWDRAESGSDTLAECAPQMDSGSLYQQIWNWDQSLNSGLGDFVATGTNITVPFRTTLGGISPEIAMRYTLMGLELVGGAAIATDHRQEQWSYWYDPTPLTDWSDASEARCDYVEDMTINMVPAADGQSATGRFTIKNFEACFDTTSGASVDTPSSGDQFSTFEVSFTKVP